MDVFVKRSAELDRSERGLGLSGRWLYHVGNSVMSEEGQDKGCVERTWGPSSKARGLDRGLEHQKRDLGVSLRAERNLLKGSNCRQIVQREAGLGLRVQEWMADEVVNISCHPRLGSRGPFL